MKISQNGNEYRLVNGGTSIMDELPPKVYTIKFHPMRGMWLEERSPLTVGVLKVYGNTPKRVDKVFRTFDLRNRNLGILLSGEKGMGKSIFMRYLANEAINRGMPVIIINDSLPGLTDFISNIEQKCVVLFDEFEKVFLKGSDGNFNDEPRDGRLGDDCCSGGEQKQFLSLFDGMDVGKKLFVVAVNNTHNISSFFLNRPGRFYYHFEFDFLTEDETKEYAMDNITIDKSLVDKLVLLSRFHDISYDILAAIVTELNNGYTLKDTLDDLNINISSGYKLYDVELVVDGVTLKGRYWFGEQPDDGWSTVWLRIDGGEYNHLKVCFDENDVKLDERGRTMFISAEDIKSLEFYEPFGRFTRKTIPVFMNIGAKNGECVSNHPSDCDCTKAKDDIKYIPVTIDRLILRPHEFSFNNSLSCLM